MVLVVSIRRTSMKILWQWSGKPAKISNRMSGTIILPLKRKQVSTLVWRSTNKIIRCRHLWNQNQTKISTRMMMSKYKKHFSKQITIFVIVNVVSNLRLRCSRTSIEQSSKISIHSQVRESAHSKPKQEYIALHLFLCRERPLKSSWHADAAGLKQPPPTANSGGEQAGASGEWCCDGSKNSTGGDPDESCRLVKYRCARSTIAGTGAGIELEDREENNNWEEWWWTGEWGRGTSHAC